ncbi:MAG: hypothetical protein FJ280_15200 [Planctomycetes bacterium]|nr:hypothetical protein [Planctomycetota bacterium]
MRFSHLHYVPCLQWKQGEYQALWQLSPKTRGVLTPLIEVPGVGYDFENARKAKTIDEHLAPFAKRVHEKWGRLPCFVDLNLISPNERLTRGVHPVRFVFEQLQERQCPAVPVTGIDRDDAYQQEIRSIVTRKESGICLRIGIEQAARGSFKRELDSLVSRLDVTRETCDMIMDLRAPNFIPLGGFAKAIQSLVTSFPHLHDWRSFTLLGTSFPKTMTGIRKGGEVVPRHEWMLYKTLIAGFKGTELRLPTFGDYTISHPGGPELDWRVVKPPATIRYTIPDGWYIVKGENVRDYGFKQYHELSRLVLASRHYCGPSASWGDAYIQMCADKNARTGNLSTWRQVGANHHVERIIRDIASFYASSSAP